MEKSGSKNNFEYILWFRKSILQVKVHSISTTCIPRTYIYAEYFWSQFSVSFTLFLPMSVNIFQGSSTEYLFLENDRKDKLAAGFNWLQLLQEITAKERSSRVRLNGSWFVIHDDFLNFHDLIIGYREP